MYLINLIVLNQYRPNPGAVISSGFYSVFLLGVDEFWFSLTCFSKRRRTLWLSSLIGKIKQGKFETRKRESDVSLRFYWSDVLKIDTDYGSAGPTPFNRFTYG